MAGATAGQLHRLLVGLLLLLTMHVAAAATATQWTVFIYLLADNDLEQYGLLDMEVCVRAQHGRQCASWRCTYQKNLN